MIVLELSGIQNNFHCTYLYKSTLFELHNLSIPFSAHVKGFFSPLKTFIYFKRCFTDLKIVGKVQLYVILYNIKHVYEI